MSPSDQGVTSDRYSLIPRVLIFIARGREVLLIKGAPEKRLWADLYNGIGGHVEQGEDILSAAYRELKEETGLQGIPLVLSGIINVETGQKIGVGIFVFRGMLKESENPPISPSEEGQIEWIHQFDMVSIPMVEDLPILIPRILSLKDGDPPLIGRYCYSAQGELQIQFIK